MSNQPATFASARRDGTTTRGSDRSIQQARAPRIFSPCTRARSPRSRSTRRSTRFPPRRRCAGWAERTPPEFSFALKLPQEITHENRLRDSADIAALFFDRARELGPKLGPILMQLGPDFAPSELPALASFLPMIPRDVRVSPWSSGSAAGSTTASSRSWPSTTWGWRSSMRGGFRESSMHVADGASDIGRRLHQMDGPQPRPRRLLAHPGRSHARARGVGERSSRPSAQRVKTVYGYVNNHFAGHSPASARELQRLLRQRPVEPGPVRRAECRCSDGVSPR